MEIQTTIENAGQLDPGFGDFGQIRPDFLAGSVMAVVLSAEGALTYATQQGKGFTLYRTDFDGIKDTNFGHDGNTGEWQFVRGKQATPVRLLLQDDRKILVIGETREPDGIRRAALRRFNANGSPDLIFGSVVVPVAQHDYSQVELIDGCLQGDGKVLVSFTYYISESQGSLLVRLHGNGELDTGFGTRGFIEIENGDDFIRVNSVVIQGGKIVVGGTTLSGQLFLARYDLQGKIESQFGVDGFAFFTITDGSLRMRQLIAQADGKLVCAGGLLDTIGMVMRFTADGHPDKEWNGGRPVLTDTGPETFWRSLAQQPDGKIVVVGHNRALHIIAGRLLPNGEHDTRFGRSGSGWVSFGPSGGLAWDVKVQSAARIIVGAEAFIDFGHHGPVVYGLQT
jgi:uncharacterized delta-60 repeat protein